MQKPISRRRVAEVAARRDPAAQQAIETAAAAIGRAERTIRGRIASLRASLDHVERQLDAGFGLSETGELGQQPTDLEMAVAVRTASYQVLAALLTAEEIRYLRPE